MGGQQAISGGCHRCGEQCGVLGHPQAKPGRGAVQLPPNRGRARGGGGGCCAARFHSGRLSPSSPTIYREQELGVRRASSPYSLRHLTFSCYPGWNKHIPHRCTALCPARGQHGVAQAPRRRHARARRHAQHNTVEPSIHYMRKRRFCLLETGSSTANPRTFYPWPAL